MRRAAEQAPETAQVDAFLRAHPGFLAERPELYRVLLPPARVHGEGLADHMTAMVLAERAEAEAMRRRAEAVLAAGRAASGIAERVQSAVLALLRAVDVADCVGVEFPGLLGVDAAMLCCEGARADWRTLPPGAVARALGGQAVVMRAYPADAALLHGEAALLARRDVLIRVPGSRPALLALVSRDEAMLPPGQGVAAFAFLGRVIAAALDR